MFGKLLKYDLKAMLKTMLPLWLLALVIGGIDSLRTGLNQSLQSFVSEEMEAVFIMVLVALFVGIFVMNIIFVVQRFWNGLLKDEGYLMFTLPVSTRKLIFSKALSSSISILGGIVVWTIIVAIMLLSSEGYYPLVKIFDGIHMTDIFIAETIQFIILVFVGIVGFVYRTYVSMSIGHLSNNHRFLLSILVYIAISIIGDIATTGVQSTSMIQILANGGDNIGLSILISVVEIVAYHIVTEFILTKKLNLE
jgi:hypothetical protein